MKPLMPTFLHDLRYALTMLRKHPGFTIVAIITLALGIGANAAIFSLVNTALLRPIYADTPAELVTIFRGGPDRNGSSAHSYPDYIDMRRESADVMTGLAAFTTRPVNLLLAGRESRRINVGLITDNYFRVLGVRPLAGRDFLPDENVTPGERPVALISENLWRRQFGAAI